MTQYPKKIDPQEQNFLIGVFIIIFVPLLPLFLEVFYTPGHTCDGKSVVLTAPIFMITVFTTSLSRLLLIISLVIAGFFIGMYAIVIIQNRCSDTYYYLSLLAIFSTAYIHCDERWDRHVNEAETFPLLN